MIFQETPELVKPASVHDLYTGKDIFKSLPQQYIDIWDYCDSLTKKEKLGIQKIKNDENLNYLEEFLGSYVLAGGVGRIIDETETFSHKYFFGTIGKLFFSEGSKTIRMKTKTPASKGDSFVIANNIDYVSLIDKDLYDKLFQTHLFFGDWTSSEGVYPYKGFPIHPSPSDKSIIYFNKSLIERVNKGYRNENNRRLF
mgnify:CR=1 FL=1